MDLSGDVNPDPRRDLPSVDRLSRELLAVRPELPRWAATEAARIVVRRARVAIENNGSPAGEAAKCDSDWLAMAAAEAARLSAHHPRRVVNATGVVLHTNLGRSPMAAGAARAAAEAGTGYCDLELDLETGKRGNRLTALSEKLCLLSGSEAATVCNNNAAAVLLALNTLAAGREVVVSRGELVEIGGSFRIPEVMERAGVRLVEVGTTNRTHPRDYERAIGPDTGLLLKVHQSNFAQSGFVKDVPLDHLAKIARAHDIPLVEDLGAGTLVDLTGRGFPPEAYAPARLRLGADLVCFSGDKLVGGPQAGLLLGDRELIAQLRENPLARALRLDKMTIAALDWTLARMLDGSAETEIPVLQQLLEPTSHLEDRALRLAALLEPAVGERASVFTATDRAPVGGGSLPGFELETWVVGLRPRAGVDRTAAALRRGDTPVLTRVRDDALLFDLRTLCEDDLSSVVAAAEAALD